MKAFGVVLGLSVALLAYLAGGPMAAMLAGLLTFVVAVVYGAVEFKKFMREREGVTGRQPSVS